MCPNVPKRFALGSGNPMGGLCFLLARTGAKPSNKRGGASPRSTPPYISLPGRGAPGTAHRGGFEIYY